MRVCVRDGGRENDETRESSVRAGVIVICNSNSNYYKFSCNSNSNSNRLHLKCNGPRPE